LGAAAHAWPDIFPARKSENAMTQKAAKHQPPTLEQIIAERQSAMDQRTPKHQPPTPQQVIAEQDRVAKKDLAAREAAPTSTAVAEVKSTAVAVPDGRTAREKYLDDQAMTSIVGRLIKFSKDGKYITKDDEVAIGDDVDFIALCDQTLIGYIKFNGEGEPPDRIMGLLYDGFVMPPEKSLPDRDKTKWEIGFDGQASDPWQHHMYLVLQRCDTTELFTFDTGSRSGRRAVANLLKHYDRTQKTHPDTFPVVRLKTGGFQHRDQKIGWVSTPVFAVQGRAPKDSAAKPVNDMNDDLPDDLK
jgi:hypothetical protein